MQVSLLKHKRCRILVKNYRDRGSIMKLASIITISLLVFWVLITILDMWFDIMSWDVFIKFSITLALLGVVALIIAIAKREYIDEKNLKKDKYID